MVKFLGQKISANHVNMPITQALVFFGTMTGFLVMVFSFTFFAFFLGSMTGSLTFMEFGDSHSFKVSRFSFFLNQLNRPSKKVINSL
jgi:hypothetical protein